MSSQFKPEISKTTTGEAKWLELVRQQVSSLRFGTVLITVHEARVVQVEKLEKVRLDSVNTATQA